MELSSAGRLQMMKVIPLVFTQRMYKSKVETKFLFYNPLHIRRDLLGFSRVLKMQDTSHQNKQCCNKCGMRRIPKKSVNIPGLMVNITKIIFVMSLFRGKNHKQYFLPLSCLCQGLKIKGRGECGQRPYGMYGTTQVADCLPVITRARILHWRSDLNFGCCFDVLQFWISRPRHEL